MANFSFWQKWLFVVGIVVSVFGVMMSLLSGTPLFDLFNRQIDPAFWSIRTVSDSVQQFQKWIYGVWGATIAGWGIFLAFIAHYPFAKKERWSWKCTIAGLLIWFVLDTSLSLVYQVYFNVAFNVGLFVLAMVPLVFTRKEFA